jgi:hypothetical protein
MAAKGVPYARAMPQDALGPVGCGRRDINGELASRIALSGPLMNLICIFTAMLEVRRLVVADQSHDT